MNIHEFIVYTCDGIEVATYPRDKELKMTSSFFSANRTFAMTNGFNEVEEIAWMKKKCLFLHSRQRNLSFAMIVDRNDDEKIARNFLADARDKFLEGIDEKLDFNSQFDKEQSTRLMRVVNDLASEHGGRGIVVIIDR